MIYAGLSLFKEFQGHRLSYFPKRSKSSPQTPMSRLERAAGKFSSDDILPLLKKSHLRKNLEWGA